MTSICRHALFDFGGPMLLTPFELNGAAEHQWGLAPGSLPKGPFDPHGDLRWQAWQRGDITERDYWAEQATPIGLDIAGYMRAFYEPAGDHLIRPQTSQLITHIQAAGYQTGLLTNDLSAFHGPEWAAAISVLGEFEPLVDLSSTGTLKPDPRAYQAALTAMDVPADTVVFLDDQRRNVAGARAVGMHAVHFDPADVDGSVQRFVDALCGADTPVE